jgi:RIO-like serine/threonine protein kinase
MSLTSKLFILINVLQSLRLIKDYEVVHMDLSPGNIIVSQNYIPQLIDFGESYSKDIC